MLIPDTTFEGIFEGGKAPAVWDGLAAYQLVGEVTAHQGDDG